MINLVKTTDRVYYYPYDDEKDRPILGYIRGDDFSVAVDAGHSAEHVADFYAAIGAEGLPLPAMTVITHWHWDHSFGMHAVTGQTIASSKTQAHLQAVSNDHGDDLRDYIISLDGYVAAEYASGQPMIVAPADLTFDDSMTIRPGGVTVELIEAVSAHTDDTTLVYIPEEGCLFMGDSVMGDFATGTVDTDKMNQMISTVDALDFKWALTGHWNLRTKNEVLADMRAQVFD